MFVLKLSDDFAEPRGCPVARVLSIIFNIVLRLSQGLLLYVVHGYGSLFQLNDHTSVCLLNCHVLLRQFV